MSYAITELEVIRWAEDRQIVQNSNPFAQSRKTLEEAGELMEATAKLQVLDELESFMPELSQSVVFRSIRKRWEDAHRDAIGDVAVTLIVGAACADIDVLKCLEGAYEQIKDRKGTLRADGVFVKE
jgi:NTP pyrophosphatase (non-canonical NTP hydrolase)